MTPTSPEAMACPSCGGRGADDEGYCASCNGGGVVLREPTPTSPEGSAAEVLGAALAALAEAQRWTDSGDECAIHIEDAEDILRAAIASLSPPRPSVLSELAEDASLVRTTLARWSDLAPASMDRNDALNALKAFDRLSSAQPLPGEGTEVARLAAQLEDWRGHLRGMVAVAEGCDDPMALKLGAVAEAMLTRYPDPTPASPEVTEGEPE